MASSLLKHRRREQSSSFWPPRRDRRNNQGRWFLRVCWATWTTWRTHDQIILTDTKLLNELLGIYEVLPAEGLGSSPYGDFEGIEGLLEVNYLSLPCDCSSRSSPLIWGCMYVPNWKASLTSLMLPEIKPVKLLALAASYSSWVSMLMTH